MQEFTPVNKWLPVTADFITMQKKKEAAIKDRGSDFHSWGIVRANAFPPSVSIPVSATDPAPNLRQALGEFSLLFDTNNGLLSVGAGSNPLASPPAVGGGAYDLNWERIAIVADAAFTFDNAIPQGLKSSGNLSIPLTLTGTAGDHTVNPSVLGTYYVWVEYLEVNDPTVQEIDRGGGYFYPEMLDGYRIRLTGTPVAPSGDGVSLFLCKIIWAAAYPEIISLTDGEVQRTNGNLISTIPTSVAGEPHRVYAAVRQQNVEVIPDPTLRPAAYVAGGRYTVQDHVSALGSGTPTPNNPHGLALADIPGGTSEPKATLSLLETQAAGIIDLGLANNTPREQSTAALPTIEQGSLIPAGLDATVISGTGITSTVKAAWVRVSTLLAGQAAYLNGTRFKQIYPNVRQTADHASDTSINPADSNTGDGWVGFSNIVGSADPVGTYQLYFQPATLNGLDVLLVNKLLLTGYPGVIPPLAANQMPLGMVYWDGNNLYRDYLAAQVPTNPLDDRPIDQRPLGLTGPAQLSTSLKEQALAAQRFDNLIGNSNFMFDKVGGQFPGWVIDDSAGAAFLPNADIVRITAAVNDPLLASGGPGALFGVKLTPVAGQTTGTTKLYAQLGYLKPNSLYTIAFQYRADGGWTSRLRAGVNLGTAGPSSVITTGSPYPGPLDVSVIDDAVYHRAYLTVKTLATVNPDPANTYYLLLQLDATATPTAAAALRLTNVQITEGEWVPGYSAASGKSVPIGANLWFDNVTVCPAGWTENVNMRGRYPIGYVPGGLNGLQTPGTALGSAATDGANTAPHTHVENIASGSGSFLGLGTSSAAAAVTSGPTPANFLPSLVGLWCRAI